MIEPFLHCHAKAIDSVIKLLQSMSQPCLPVRRKRGREKSQTSTQSDTIDGFDDLASMDGAEYLARVVKQAKRLPDIFVAPEEETERTSSTDSKLRDHVPIDGSAASLSYLLSGKASITPPPSKEHLPQSQDWIDTTIKNFESYSN